MKPKSSLIPRFNLDYNFSDFLLGMKSILSKNNISLRSLESIFGEKIFLFTNYGRTSLYLILKSLNLPRDSKIGVPLYSCTVVFDAIIKAGYTPCFIDIDLNNYTMSPKDLKEKIDELSAIVVIHTFGRPADMDKINKIANGIPVIEDCAHSLMSKYKGKMTGTLSKVSFFSLTKYISAGGGGMIILDDKELAQKIQKNLKTLKTPSKLNEVNHLIYTFAFSHLYHRPWYGLFSYPLGSFIEGSIDIAGKRIFKIRKIYSSDLRIFVKKLEKFKEKVEIQRKNSKILLNELECTSLELPYEEKNTWCNYYLFPIRFESKKKRDNTYKYLRKVGIDSAKLFSKTPLLARQFYGYKGNCPNSEKCADTILIIPNYFTLNQNELLRIAENIKKAEELL